MVDNGQRPITMLTHALQLVHCGASYDTLKELEGWQGPSPRASATLKCGAGYPPRYRVPQLLRARRCFLTSDNINFGGLC